MKLKLDFIKQLRDTVNDLGIPFVCKLGILDSVDSLCLYPLSGGRTIKNYMDGMKDKQLNFEFAIKTKDNTKAYETLNDIAAQIELLDDLPSKNGSYDFQKIKVVSDSYLIGLDEQGYFVYNMIIQTELTILN